MRQMEIYAGLPIYHNLRAFLPNDSINGHSTLLVSSNHSKSNVTLLLKRILFISEEDGNIFSTGDLHLA
jgi:hypothetical protein